MKAIRIMSRRLAIGVAAVLAAAPLWGDNAVDVTIEAADTTLAVGESTTVTVYGRIAAAIEPDCDQIFSWYVDVLNDNGAVAGDIGNVQTPTSDNHPSTSDDGTAEGGSLRGVHDTFLDLPGAGKATRVMLLQFEVTAKANGTATLSVAPGTTAGPLNDFLVARTGVGSYTGGNYSAAAVQITVGEGGEAPALDLRISRAGSQVDLSFDPLPGFNHTVQWSPDLGASGWNNLAGGPHNAGAASETVGAQARRFYRVLFEPQ